MNSKNRTTDPATPQTFEGLRDLILSRHANLPKRLAQVARFAIENPDDIAFGTAASIAISAAVQPSTLVRLAQSLGYQGFSDLQAVFRDRLRDKTSTYEERLSNADLHLTGGSQTMAIVSGFLDSAAQSVAKLSRELDEAKIERAADLLAQAETIYVVAQRRSYPLAVYLGYIFGKLKMRTVVVGTSSGIDTEMLAQAGSRDAALSISFSPYASTTVEWTRILGANDVPIVGLTDSVFSPIAELSDAWIEIVEADFEGFRSLSATTALVMALAVVSARKRRNEADA